MASCLNFLCAAGSSPILVAASAILSAAHPPPIPPAIPPRIPPTTVPTPGSIIVPASAPTEAPPTIPTPAPAPATTPLTPVLIAFSVFPNPFSLFSFHSVLALSKPCNAAPTPTPIFPYFINFSPPGVFTAAFKSFHAVPILLANPPAGLIVA